jgi:hypothetical protein
MPKVYSVEAQIHKQLEKGFRVKVLLLDLGVYINGFRVLPPNEEHDKWTVYPPSQHVGFGNYITVVEFDKKHMLWIEIYEACVEAVQIYMSQGKDVVITDIPDGPITLDDIPDF